MKTLTSARVTRQIETVETVELLWPEEDVQRTMSSGLDRGLWSEVGGSGSVLIMTLLSLIITSKGCT